MARDTENRIKRLRGLLSSRNSQN